MKSKRTGIVLIIIGLLYLFTVSWLSSWWYVPDYRQSGPDFVSGSSWYTSVPFFIIWGISAPLGSLLLIIGSALYVQVEMKYILFFIFGSVILLWWLGFWNTCSINSKLYGIGGGIILCSFLISVWNWVKKRSRMESRNRLASDIRIISHLFFFIAAWGLCGLMGTPLFGLRPEKMIEFKTQQGAYTMGIKVMTCLALGWILLTLSQHIELHSKKNSV
jgi:hypothetical protein